MIINRNVFDEVVLFKLLIIHLLTLEFSKEAQKSDTCLIWSEIQTAQTERDTIHHTETKKTPTPTSKKFNPDVRLKSSSFCATRAAQKCDEDDLMSFRNRMQQVPLCWSGGAFLPSPPTHVVWWWWWWCLAWFGAQSCHWSWNDKVFLPDKCKSLIICSYNALTLMVL